MKHSIAVNSNCYHGYSIEEAIDSISSNGFRYIELTATKGWTEHVFPTMSFKDLVRIKGLLRDAKLNPIAMSGHTNLMDQERLGDFLDNIKLAAFYDCQYIVSSIGEAHLEDKAVTTNEKAAENIRQLLPYLKEYGLTLVLENHGEHATGKIIKEIVDLVDSPRVLINYDTANVIYYADVNPVDDIPYFVDRIGFMHIKDKIGGPGEWHFPALGKGYVDFPKILELLDKADNHCPLSIEIEFTQAGPKDLDEVHQAVGDSYKYLKSLGLEI
jgi:sugar phosphate isomerase/epimerase